MPPTPDNNYKFICNNCGVDSEHRHIHEAAHGIEGTHMGGSERFVCVACGYSLGKQEGEAIGIGELFILD